MYKYQKAIAQEERKTPYIMYHATLHPLTKQAERAFSKGLQKNAQGAYETGGPGYPFYYLDPAESEQERQKQAIEGFQKGLAGNVPGIAHPETDRYWGSWGGDFGVLHYGVDYHIEVRKEELHPEPVLTFDDIKAL